MSATNNASLSGLSLNAMVALYNGAVEDYAPEGFNTVERFKSKGAAIERIERMCEAGSLAVNFDGDNATIVDAMEAPASGDDADAFTRDDAREIIADARADAETRGDDAMVALADKALDALDGGEGDDTTTVDDADDANDDATADEGDADASAYGDGKGEVAASGFRRASGDWLKANARGSEEREAYRKARRKAAREARKAGRAAKEAALNEAAGA